MKKVPDMSTKDSRAVLGSPTTFSVSGVLLFTTNGLKVLELYMESFTSTTIAEQRLRGCSWNICGIHQQSRGLHDYIRSKTQSKDDSNYLDQFWEGLVDEDERDEDGEDLLGEARHKSHQEAPFKGHRENYNDDQPNSNPCASCQKLDFIGPAELQTHWFMVTFRFSCYIIPVKHFTVEFVCGANSLNSCTTFSCSNSA